LWLAGRHRLRPESPLFVPDPLALMGVVSLGGVNDLEHSLDFGGRTDILTLLGVSSAAAAAPLFAETSPRRLLPLGIPQVLVLGSLEDQWRIEMTRGYAAAAERSGDRVRLLEPEGIDHFDVVDPFGPAFATIAQEAAALAGVIVI
jgi:ABC-type sugar transport system substrate-binding protein